MVSVPIIIDFETSGFGQDSYPIEVGFSGRHGEGWCSLIRPEESWIHWDTTVEAIHHIRREVLVERGNSAQFVAEQLNFFLGGLTVYTDAWGQDCVWLARLYEVAKLSPRFKLVDLFEIIEAPQLAIWDATKENIFKEMRMTRHRASSDARVLQLTWLRTHDATLKRD